MRHMWLGMYQKQTSKENGFKVEFWVALMLCKLFDSMWEVLFATIIPAMHQRSEGFDIDPSEQSEGFDIDPSLKIEKVSEEAIE